MFVNRERSRGNTVSSSHMNAAATLRLNLNGGRPFGQELQATLVQGVLAASMPFQAADRVLERRQSHGHRLESVKPAGLSLGEALASVPNDLGFSSSGFRVVIAGRKRELTPRLNDEIYHIVREGIVNALCHSGAPQIETEIEYRPSELRITIRDNGCGIDSQELQWGQNGRGGLQGMRERAERIGARLRLLSKVSLGTEVELSVPGRIAFTQTGVGISC